MHCAFASSNNQRERERERRRANVCRADKKEWRTCECNFPFFFEGCWEAVSAHLRLHSPTPLPFRCTKELYAIETLQPRSIFLCFRIHVAITAQNSVVTFTFFPAAIMRSISMGEKYVSLLFFCRRGSERKSVRSSFSLAFGGGFCPLSTALYKRANFCQRGL